MSAAAHRVLFVCTGNTCRSPMAEALMRAATAERSDISIGSAGVAAYDGGAASSQALEVMDKRGISLADHSSRQVTKALVDEATHIFCLTARHAGSLVRAFPDAVAKITLVGDHVELDGTSGFDVPDPFGQEVDVYEDVAVVIDEAIPGMLAHIDASSAT